jgi:hypothetical protein
MLTAQFGELIAAAFDEAARFSKDPKEVSRLATQAVQHLMQGARRLSIHPLRIGGIEAPGTLA